MTFGDIFYELTIGLFLKLCDMTDIVLDFLFTTIDVGINIDWIGVDFSWSFEPWQLIGGTIFLTLLIAWFIKKLVPVA